jgi:predicted Zn-dependent protease
MTAPHRAAVFFVSTAAAFLLLALPVQADHWWGGGFHWPRLATFDLALGDNVSAAWNGHVDAAAADWNDVVGSYDQMINVVVGAGTTNAKQCRASSGRVEVCNGAYGFNGWIGIAQAWLANDFDHIHITQATVKFNDSYFTLPEYNSLEYRQMVACHEIGHTLGLGHRDEDFENAPIGSCLDYSADPLPNQGPDDHDFQQLDDIYTMFTEHLLAPTGPGGGKGRGKVQVDPGDAAAWGHLMADNGREALFEAELGQGRRLVTFVLWAR